MTHEESFPQRTMLLCIKDTEQAVNRWEKKTHLQQMPTWRRLSSVAGNSNHHTSSRIMSCDIDRVARHPTKPSALTRVFGIFMQICRKQPLDQRRRSGSMTLAQELFADRKKLGPNVPRLWSLSDVEWGKCQPKLNVTSKWGI